MAKLTGRQRASLPAAMFAIPETRSYPIPDLSHARNALARVSEYGSATEKRQVRAAVHSRYPSLAQALGGKR